MIRALIFLCPSACRTWVHSWGRAHFRYALKLNPEDVEAHCEYARLLARFGHRHEAEVQYKKALELDPGHLGTLRGYADLLKEKGQYADAEEIYRQAELFKRSAW